MPSKIADAGFQRFHLIKKLNRKFIKKIKKYIPKTFHIV